MNSIMLRSDFARKFELFENDCRYAWEDQVFWTKVSLHGRIYLMDAVLSKYRQHPASTVLVDSKQSEDISRMILFARWLEEYLNEQNVSNRMVWTALKRFKRTLRIEKKLKWLKQLYRHMFPLYLRYKVRDKLTRTKQILSRPPHRHK